MISRRFAVPDRPYILISTVGIRQYQLLFRVIICLLLLFSMSKTLRMDCGIVRRQTHIFNIRQLIVLVITGYRMSMKDL